MNTQQGALWQYANHGLDHRQTPVYPNSGPHTGMAKANYYQFSVAIDAEWMWKFNLSEALPGLNIRLF